MIEEMNTKVAAIHTDEKGNVIEQGEIKRAGEILKKGGLVAFPTETVYGLGGNAFSREAAKKIYEAKGRPSDNPLIVHIARHEDLEELTAAVPDKAYRLAEAFWPGPLTMILKKNSRVPMETTGGLDTVAIREPNHPVALALIREGCFLAAPSANLSGRPSPTTAAHVVEDLSGRIDMILDGGPVGLGVESTILDLSEEIPTILRPGFITAEELSGLIGEVRIDPGIMGSDPSLRPKAPGMKYRHYAPKAPLTLFYGKKEDVIARINAEAEEELSRGKRGGILATEESAGNYPKGQVLSIGSRFEEASVARHLYGILRQFDEIGVDLIFSECFEEKGIGLAIMNRLKKAAGQHIIKVE